MQFYRKKARSMGVPIVPMIDILTILLIFFIVHTQWKKPQSLLKIDVPGAEFMEGTPSSEQRAVLAVTGTSAISLNGRLVEMNELAAALEALKKENPGVKLQLDVDKKAEFGVIVGIWDALTSVGIDAGEVPARIEIRIPAVAPSTDITAALIVTERKDLNSLIAESAGKITSAEISSDNTGWILILMISSNNRIIPTAAAINSLVGSAANTASVIFLFLHICPRLYSF